VSGNRLTLSKPRSSRSWYGGTWPRGNKATPVTQVAKESISAAGGAASDVVASARAHTPQLSSTPLKAPAVYLSRTIGSSSRSLPLAATTTKLNISSDTTSPTNGATKERRASKDGEGTAQDGKPLIEPKMASQEEKTEITLSDDKLPATDDTDSKPKDRPFEDAKTISDSASWLNWFSKAEQARDPNQTVTKPGSEHEGTSDGAKDRPQSTMLEPPTGSPTLPTKQRRNSDPSPASPKTQEEAPPRSWLSLWGNATTQTSTTSAASATGGATNTAGGSTSSESLGNKTDETKADLIATPRPPSQPADTGKSYGWAFWSRDQSKDKDGKAQSGSNVGELALTDFPSQSKPEDAVVDEARGVPNKVEKRQRPQSFEASDSTKMSTCADRDKKKDGTPDAGAAIRKAKSTAEAGSKAKRIPENLLLPSFRRTYGLVGRPSLLQQLGRFLQLSPSSNTKHVEIVTSPPRIRRALAIVSSLEVTTPNAISALLMTHA